MIYEPRFMIYEVEGDSFRLLKALTTKGEAKNAVAGARSVVPRRLVKDRRRRFRPVQLAFGTGQEDDRWKDDNTRHLERYSCDSGSRCQS